MKRKRDDSELRISNWFTGDTATQIPRRHEVWALLGWYHRRVVEPQLGVRGFFRRLWWRWTGQTGNLSPWREVQERIDAVKAQRQLMHAIEQNRGDTPAPPADEPPASGIVLAR